MVNLTKLLDTTQAKWPLLSSLSLVGIGNNLPVWAIEAAQQVAMGLQPSSIAVYRGHLRRQADQLAALHRRWVVAAVLAVLLAMAVVSHALGTPPDSVQIGILTAVLSAILLPPLAICNGIARDYIAAQALLAVLNGAVERVNTVTNQ